MAKMLISSLEADFEPQKYHDAYRDNLQKMIEAKIEGKKVVETPGRARGPGHRHHGSAQAQPGRKAQAGAGGHRQRRRAVGRDADGSRAQKARAQDRVAPAIVAGVFRFRQKHRRQDRRRYAFFNSISAFSAPAGVSSCLNIKYKSRPVASNSLARAANASTSSSVYSGLRRR